MLCKTAHESKLNIYIPWRYLELCTFSYISIMFLSYHYVSNPKCHCKIIYFQLVIKKTYQSYTKRNEANVRNQKRNSFAKVSLNASLRRGEVKYCSRGDFPMYIKYINIQE